MALLFVILICPQMFGSVQHSPAVFVRAAFDLSNLAQNKKSAVPNGTTDPLELLARFELATSSLSTILE